MLRTTLLAISVAMLLSSPLRAQEWAEKMFAVRSYDFGSIARGAKAEYAFELTNLYLEDVHIADVRVTPLVLSLVNVKRCWRVVSFCANEPLLQYPP